MILVKYHKFLLSEIVEIKAVLSDIQAIGMLDFRILFWGLWFIRYKEKPDAKNG